MKQLLFITVIAFCSCTSKTEDTTNQTDSTTIDLGDSFERMYDPQYDEKQRKAAIDAEYYRLKDSIEYARKQREIEQMKNNKGISFEELQERAKEQRQKDADNPFINHTPLLQ